MQAVCGGAEVLVEVTGVSELGGNIGNFVVTFLK